MYAKSGDICAAYTTTLFIHQNTLGSWEKYSEQSLQSVLKQALQKIGNTKPVTLHWLRDSYADPFARERHRFALHSRIIRK